jgi:hypothetical protein
MFSKIICSGDSFSSGYRLDNPQLAWPYLLGNKLNIPTINLAHAGKGNEYIFNSIIDYFILNPDHKKDSLVICGISSINRVEFIDARTNTTFTTLINNRDNDPLIKLFYEGYYDEKYYFIKFLRNLILTQNYLESNNIDYLFFNALPLLHPKNLINDILIKNLLKQINYDNYLWFYTKNMCNIIYPNQLPDGHPNAIGHEMMAETLYKIILDKSE